MQLHWSQCWQKKAVSHALSDAETAIEREQLIATVREEIAAPETCIKDLDTSVTEAIERRKAERKEFSDLMASNCCRGTPKVWKELKQTLRRKTHRLIIMALWENQLKSERGTQHYFLKSATKANMEGYLVSILWRSQVEKCKMVFTMRLLCAALIASCDVRKMDSAARRFDNCVAGNAASYKGH